MGVAVHALWLGQCLTVLKQFDKPAQLAIGVYVFDAERFTMHRRHTECNKNVY